MAGGDSKLFNLLSYAVSGGSEDSAEENGSGEKLAKFHEVCSELIRRDYACETLENTNGYLCSTYPAKLIIPISESGHGKISTLKDYVLKGRFARTRGRFVVPVLLFNNKYVCRSSTLARSPEIYCRRSYGYWMHGETYDEVPEEKNGSESSNGQITPLQTPQEQQSSLNGIHHSPEDLSADASKSRQTEDEDTGSKEWLLDKMRNADINLLQYLKVDTIFDLMVENKKVKFGMNVTSSEKVDRQKRYLKFNLLSVPYPGCEFFAEYGKREYCAEGLMFDWNQNFVDANFHVPKKILSLCEAQWKDYMKWDLVELTKNYLLLHLRSFVDKNSTGILLHCISGWDRTPLFISLMRLSLWADGLIHQSLNVEEMVYFTVAYDWLLFNHRFSDRIANGEEIFYFCFDFLKYIYSDEFSMLTSSIHTPNIDNHTDKSGNILNGSHHEGVETLELLQPNGTSLNGFANLNLTTEEAQNGNILHEEMNGNTLHETYSENSPLQRVSDSSPLQKTENLSDESSAVLEIEVSTTFEGGQTHSSVPIGIKEDTETMQNENAIEPDIEECVEQGKSDRKEKLMCARKLVLEAYAAAVRWQREREQASNTGFAATLFSQISKTLNLVKK